MSATCPTCGSDALSYDGSCGGELAKCLDCGRMVMPSEMAEKRPEATKPDEKVSKDHDG